MNTFTALQLKADSSPKPSTPYYCDISNLSQPMTGLMIMFPVLFQPQITANSVITGLLCQPSSGPLTGCWPSSRLLTTPVCLGRGRGLRKPRASEKTTTENCNSATVHHGLLITTVLVVNSRVLILSLLFLLEHQSLRSSQDRRLSPFQPSQQVRWHLNQVSLFWLDPLS